jgi:hypothetical protein
MAWNAWICDTQTGENRFRVRPVSMTWERVINASGGGSCQLHLADPETAEVATWEGTRPIKKSLVLAWDQYIVYAGIIWSRKYDRNNQTLDITHSDIWSILKYRYLLLSHANGAAAGPPVSWTGQSLHNHAKFIVQLATDAASAMFKMPIVYPADTSGSESRTYQPYNMPVAADALDAVMSTEGGPDVDFHPYWDDQSRLRHEMRIGDLSGREWDFHMGAPSADGCNLTFTDDATKVSNTIFGIGEGSEKDIALRVISNPGSAFPGMERQVSLKPESDAGRMDALLREKMRIYAEPTTQVAFEMLADGEPNVLDLRLGGMANIYYQSDPWIAKGRHGERVIQFSGDLTNKIKITGQQLGT